MEEGRKKTECSWYRGDIGFACSFVGPGVCFSWSAYLSFVPPSLPEQGAVTCIHSFVNDEKTVLVAVGRDDGTVELINPSAEGVGAGFVDSASTEASRYGRDVK